MPLPLIIPLIIAGAGALGLGKTVKAGIDNINAKNTNELAQYIADEAQEELENAKETVHEHLTSYGEKKLIVIDTHLKKFIETLKLIQNVEFATGENTDDLSQISITRDELEEISETVSLVAETISGGIGGLGGGALAAFGAYNGTMLLASAGTGTAISTLSGAAAANATLAWLGGGTLAAGGLGMAGGAMVLGVLVAGPALLIFGSILGAKAKEKLYNAEANYERAQKIEAELSLVSEKLHHISEAINICHTVIDKFSGKMRRGNKKLVNLIEASGTDYRNYTEDEKKSVYASVKIAQVLKLIVDLPLLNEDGELITDSVQKISGITL